MQGQHQYSKKLETNLNIKAPHICKRNPIINTCIKEITLLLLRIKICTISLVPVPFPSKHHTLVLKSVFTTKFNQSTSIIIYISFNLKVVSLITNQSQLKYLNLQAFIQLVTKQMKLTCLYFFHHTRLVKK